MVVEELGSVIYAIPPDALGLLPAVSPIQIAVLPLTNWYAAPPALVSPAKLQLKIINILLVDDVGVIETDKPVTSVKDVADVENVSVLVVLTTCNTAPAGNDALAILLAAVVSVPAKVAFCEVSSVSAVVPLLVCNTNEPVVSAVATSAVADVVPAERVDAMFYPYITNQRWPLETVTDCPDATVTGPTDIALNPVPIV